MNISISATPVFHLRVTRPVLDILIKLSTNHYDSRCRLLYARAGQGQVNGLLRIWDDALLFATSEGELNAMVSASFRDLDLLLKCMEMHSGLSKDESSLVGGLRRDFFNAMWLSNSKREEWTAEYVSPDLAAAAA